jgi:putative redox protein
MTEKEVVSTKWLEDMSFESEINGHKLILDAKAEFGGQDKGPRPKPLMLAALGGCTSMDVVSILKKMHVIYEVEGENLPLDKIQKAVSLSEDQYCGVSAVYKEVMEITSEIRINSQA